MLDHFHEDGFISILVYFDLPSHVLQKRVASSGRSSVLRITVSFEEVLDRQEARYHNGEWTAPAQHEVDYLFVINDPNQVELVKQKVISIAQAT
ncbi:hypothetical protein [Paenibacillus dokdonensis]|uniref:hypothetical protein n=1 Tax=Paenibacillus dokdonensis TaxID=2567944 RepID=UPI003D2D40BD